ncbi:auxin efflux carrier component [Datura stramonium]|uniref:Auxin efflux carrier component n=1 Tax=Datura stramonium TaxID=4076 RepID=A0ABS8V3V5_DATST|nr:auxin efflux carrier component [Datura stramonium]
MNSNVCNGAIILCYGGIWFGEVVEDILANARDPTIFVAVFAVPVLSFHFISQNNPCKWTRKFILADTLSKILVLVLLSVWAICKGQLDWLITLFSVSTLPNTLVMGIPLLNAMYGNFTQASWFSLFVLQCIICNAAAAITKFEIDNDVISLDGRNPLCTESEVDGKGRIPSGVSVGQRHLRRSRTFSSSIGITPRHQISPMPRSSPFPRLYKVPHPGAGISVRTRRNLSVGFHSRRVPRLSGYASSDAYSLQPTPRASNFNELDTATVTTTGNTPMWVMSPGSGGEGVPAAKSPSAKIAWESPGKSCRHGDRQGYIDDVGVQGAANTNNIKQEMPNALVMLRLIIVMVGRKLSRNPNTYSSILGLIWSLISFKWNVGMPSLVKYSVKIISDAGLGMAMFSLGLFMALQPRIIACGTKMAAIGMAIRFIGGPLVMSAASIAVGLRSFTSCTVYRQLFPKGISICVRKRIWVASGHTKYWGYIWDAGFITSNPPLLYPFRAMKRKSA